MTLERDRTKFQFATNISGPMAFTFNKVLNIEKKKVSRDIQSNGGRVVEYNERNEYTIVLTKQSKQSSDEIQFDVKYIQDCLKRKKILPLETYRIGKVVKVGCYYSQPFGTKWCVYSKFIRHGKCNKHNCVPTDQSAEKITLDSEDKLKQQLEFIENLIYVERKPQVKNEPELIIEEAQESQSFD